MKAMLSMQAGLKEGSLFNSDKDWSGGGRGRGRHEYEEVKGNRAKCGVGNHRKTEWRRRAGARSWNKT